MTRSNGSLARPLDRVRGGLRLVQLASGAATSSAISRHVSRSSSTIRMRAGGRCGHDGLLTAATAGSIVKRRAVRPASLATAIVPPSAVTTSRVMLSPSPVPRPAALVVTHGSKMLREHIRGDARAGVANLDPHAVARRRLGGERQRAALRHRVERVGHEVEQRQLQLRLVRPRRRRRLAGTCRSERRRPPRASRARIASPIVASTRVDTNRLALGDRACARSSRSRTADAIRSTCSSTMRSRRCMRRIGDLLLQQLHVAGNEIERRADLMRDVGDRLSDGGQLLRAGGGVAQLRDALVRSHELLVALAQFARSPPPRARGATGADRRAPRASRSGRRRLPASRLSCVTCARAPRSPPRARAVTRRISLSGIEDQAPRQQMDQQRDGDDRERRAADGDQPRRPLQLFDGRQRHGDGDRAGHRSRRDGSVRDESARCGRRLAPHRCRRVAITLSTTAAGAGATTEVLTTGTAVPSHRRERRKSSAGRRRRS